MSKSADSTYLLDEYVATKAGEPYRLFPFGTVVKGGVAREITPESAAQFKLPHFKPPIKLGSHAEATPAGGHILSLEVRDDGLYAIPELTEKGATALDDGDYRYHSPEVIWAGGFLEHPETGKAIEGPMIVGDALLHTPHLGEAAALYSVTPTGGNNTMSETNIVALPESLLDKLMALVGRTPEPATLEAATESGPSADEFAAVTQERDRLEAEIEQMKAEGEQAERIERFSAAIAETPISGDEKAASILAGMSDEQSEWVVTQFKALSAQIDESKLTGNIGASGKETDGADNAADALDQAVQAYASEHKVSYNEALAALRTEQPDLFSAYAGA